MEPNSKRKIIINCIAWAVSYNCLDKQISCFKHAFTNFNNNVENESFDFQTGQNYNLFAALCLTLTPEEMEIEDKTELFLLFTQCFLKHAHELQYKDILNSIGKDSEIAEKMLNEWESNLNDFRLNNYNKQI